jgi:cation diffusion facilitator CzcD-associated flavoprotein CzcO
MTKPDTDVLIIGAGLSGIGAAVHLGKQCPGKTYRIFEQRSAVGGTWDLFRYPGIRSDSDMHTLGFNFKPWTEAKAIADGPSIRKYIRETADDYGITPHIQFDTKIIAADWSTPEQVWHITSENTKTGARSEMTARFLFMCGGYYNYDQGYRPDFPGEEAYKGQFVHPQHWPEDLDYTGKKVVIIGSGATAMTLVPAMAEKAGHVTMLQRSPTYFFCHPNQNELADRLREIGVDEPTVHRVVRQQIMHDQDMLTKRCIEEPDAVFEELKELIRAYAGEDFEFEPHFTPKYRVWQQRLAFCPDGDVFQAVKAGKASVVTDTIDRFTEKGVLTASGEEIEADIIVAATGFNLSVMGNMDVTVDGETIDWHDTLTYRGMMFTGVPNMVWVMGYFRASWTLRVDMMGDFVCHLLRHMRESGASRVEVSPPGGAGAMQLGPWIDPDNFNPGYLKRGMDRMPMAGDRPEWRHTQDYWSERDDFPKIDLAGPEFRYTGEHAAQREPEVA